MTAKAYPVIIRSKLLRFFAKRMWTQLLQQNWVFKTSLKTNTLLINVK